MTTCLISANYCPMARPLRITYEGAVYHVTVRGNERRALFLSTEDHERFMQKLAESVRMYDVRLYLFCQMTNHAHMVLETPQANLSRFMQRLKTAHAVYFNQKHNRHGHLFQGRFGATTVEEDEYILKLSRYVHLNPVFIKAHQKKTDRERVQILRNYQWSSYRSYIGRNARLDFVDYDPILSMMDPPKKKQPASYRRFVEGGIRNIDTAFIDTKRRARFCIGSDESQECTRERYQEMLQAYDCKEDVSFRRDGGYHSADMVLSAILEILGVPRKALMKRRRNSLIRPLVAYALCQYAGRTQREAAEIMGGCSGVAVSLQLKKLHEQLTRDKELQKIVSKLEKRLASLER